jgi:hypothetical protein
MAYKFQLGAARLSGSLVQEGALEAQTSLTIGNAVLTEAELEKLDGITNGTAAADKAVVLDNNSRIAGIDRITGVGRVDATERLFVEGASGGEAKLDINSNSGRLQIANSDDEVVIKADVASKHGRLRLYEDGGSAAHFVASTDSVSSSAGLHIGGAAFFEGAVEMSSSIRVDGTTTLNGNTNIGYPSAGDTVNIRALVSSDLVPRASGGAAEDLGSNARQWKDLYIDGVAYIDDLRADALGSALDANSQAITNINVDSGAIDGTAIGASTPSTAKFTDVSGSGTLQAVGAATFGGALSVSGAVKLAGVADAALALGEDSFYFKDGDGTMKSESLSDYGAAIAGDGLAATNGVLALNIPDMGTELSTATLADTDEFAISDDGTMKKIDFQYVRDSVFADVSGDATVAAGGALTIGADAVEGSMLNDNVISGQTELAHADIADADELMISDGGTLKKVGLDSLQNHYFAAISGDATVADGGALTIAAGAVENSMLADDAVGADELAADAVVNASVASNAAIALSKIDTNVDMGGAFTIGSQSDDLATFTGGVIIGGDLTVQGSTISIDATTINITSSFVFEGPADAHETTLDAGVPTADITVTLPQYNTAGTVHMAVLADATTAAAAAVTAAEFALLDGASTVATVALADGDAFMHNDAGTMKQTNVLKIAEYAYSKISGDATVASGGALTLGTGVVESGMLNDNIISGRGALGSAAAAQADEMLFSDGGVLKKITFSNLEDSIFGNVSGDATVAAGGALTIANDAVEQAMIADDAVGADQLAANAVVNASIASGAAIDLDKLDGGSCAASLSDLAQGDLLYAGDVDSSNAIKSITFSDLEDAIFGNVSGDAAIAAGGALTIANDAVEQAMIADDAVGADQLAANAVVNASIASGAAIDLDKLDGGSCASALTDLAQGDLMYAGDVDDSNNIKSITFSNLEDAIFGNVSGDASIAAGGVLTIDTGAVHGSMLNDDAISGRGALTSGLALTDELMVSDSGTLKRMDVSVLNTFVGENLTVAVALKDDSGTLAVGVNYFGAHGGAESVTLPASAGLTAGQSVRIKAGSDCSASNTLTINRAGSQTIDGVASIILESPFAAVELVYVAADTWRVF